MIDTLLREIGLTDYETKIYLSLLEIGESTSGKIMTKASINSGRIYQILESLKEKGIISEVIRNGIRYFSPTNPKKILNYLEEKEARLKKQKEEINSIIPEILSKINSKADVGAKIEVYTGFEGMKTAFIKETERYGKDESLYVLGVKPDGVYPQKITAFFRYNIYPERQRKKVNVKKLNDSSFRKSGVEIEPGVEVRYLDYPSIATFNIIGNLSIISIHSEVPIVITIESEEVAKGFKTQFETLWKIAKP